jgi:hypothetical protein
MQRGKTMNETFENVLETNVGMRTHLIRREKYDPDTTEYTLTGYRLIISNLSNTLHVTVYYWLDKQRYAEFSANGPYIEVAGFIRTPEDIVFVEQALYQAKMWAQTKVEYLETLKSASPEITWE